MGIPGSLPEFSVLILWGTVALWQTEESDLLWPVHSGEETGIWEMLLCMRLF